MIYADWINAGEITGVSINIGNGVFVVDKEGAVTIKSGNFNIGGGVFSVENVFFFFRWRYYLKFGYSI